MMMETPEQDGRIPSAFFWKGPTRPLSEPFPFPRHRDMRQAMADEGAGDPERRARLNAVFFVRTGVSP